MTGSRAGALGRRRWRRIALIAGIAVVVLAIAAVAVISWLFSSELLEVDHSLGPFGHEIERVEVREDGDGGVASFVSDEILRQRRDQHATRDLRTRLRGRARHRGRDRQGRGRRGEPSGEQDRGQSR
jgi:hypothetical protein